MLTSVGIMFPVSIVVGGAAGYYIDQQLGTLPLFAAIFLVMGIAGAFINLFRALRKFEELSAEEDSSHPTS